MDRLLIIGFLYTMIFGMIPISMFIEPHHFKNYLTVKRILAVHQVLCLIGVMIINIFIGYNTDTSW